MFTRRGLRLLALLLAASSAAHAAPQSWELQGGQWRPVSQEAASTQPVSDPTLDRAEQLLTHTGYEPARKTLLTWLKRNKKSPLRDRALLLLAEAYYQRGDRLTSFYECDHLMDEFPESPLYYRALELQYKIAESFLSGFKRRLFGLAILGAEGEGVEMLYRIQQRSPGSPLAEQALLRTADYYYATAQYDLSADAYSMYVRQYTRSPMIPRARLRAAFSALAQFRGLKYDATPLVEARTQLVDIAMAYPDLAKQENLEDVVQRIDKSAARKLLDIGDFYLRTDNPASAAYHYRFVAQSYPNTPEADRANRELARLPDKVLDNPPPPGGVDLLNTPTEPGPSTD
jgi:outer membrane assembly lipoprotein YfiO